MTPFEEADARLGAMHGYEPVIKTWRYMRKDAEYAFAVIEWKPVTPDA